MLAGIQGHCHGSSGPAAPDSGKCTAPADSVHGNATPRRAGPWPPRGPVPPSRLQGGGWTVANSTGSLGEACRSRRHCPADVLSVGTTLRATGMSAPGCLKVSSTFDNRCGTWRTTAMRRRGAFISVARHLKPSCVPACPAISQLTGLIQDRAATRLATGSAGKGEVANDWLA